MPKLEFVLKKIKDFKKVDYRPWNDNIIESLTIQPQPILKNKHEKEKQITNSKQTDNKQITNTPPNQARKQQNQKETDNKQITNSKQTDNKQITAKLKQITNSKQTDNQTDNKLDNKQITNSKQTDNKQITKLNLNQLIGNEREIFYFLFSKCRLSGSQKTPPICLEIIKNELNLKSTNLIKTSLYRLIKKGFLIRCDSKTGRSGWTIFEIPINFYQQSLIETDNKQITNSKQTDNKQITKQITEQITNYSSSSNSNIYNNTNTTNDNKQKITLPPDWQEIDILPLRDFHFTKEHLTQIYRKSQLTAEMVQESIYAYAFDLKENNKIKQIGSQPINYFMGILVKGMPYAPPDNYESPHDRALRLFIEQKRKVQIKKQALEEEALLFAYTEWQEQLPIEEVKNIIPEFLQKGLVDINKKPPFIEAELKSYFKDNIWDQKKITLIQNLENQ